MRLTVVGCSGSFPGPDSPTSCYLVEETVGERTWRILLDLGSGALGALQRYADPLRLDGIFLSHLHADHCLDLCGLYVMRKYHPAGHQGAVAVWGPVGTAGRIERAYDLPPGGMAAEFEFHTHAEPVRIGPFTIEPLPVEHPVPGFGLRVEAGGRVLAYTGDTGPCAGLDTLSAGAHLLLAEASFVSSAENPPGIHLTGADCGQLAASAGVDRLVLTHIPPWHDPEVLRAEAASRFAGSLDLARPGARYEV